jgi:hypothetical protein
MITTLVVSSLAGAFMCGFALVQHLAGKATGGLDFSPDKLTHPFIIPYWLMGGMAGGLLGAAVGYCYVLSPRR